MSGDADANTIGPHESRGASVIAAAVVSLLMSFVFLVMRFISRAVVIKDLGWSDWTVAMGWFFSLANTVGVFLQVKYTKLGAHAKDIPLDFDFELGAKMVYWSLLVYILGLISIKLSILLLYLRIFRTANVHHLCYAVMAYVVLAGAETFFSSVFNCIPVEAFWDRAGHPEAKCISTITKSWVDIGIHLGGEIAILLTPVPFIYKLTMPRKQKILVSMLFSLGIFVILVGLIRIHPVVLLMSTKDVLWDTALLSIWSSIEINTAIVCSCAMTLRPLLVRFFPRFAGSGYIEPSTNSGNAHNGDGPYPPTVGSRRERKIRDPNASLLEEGESIELPVRGTESQTALRASDLDLSRVSSQTQIDDEPLAGPSSERIGSRYH